MKKAALYTLGCRVNQYETEAMAEILKKHGYEIVDFDSSADVYIINTCTVTSMGDKKSRQIIRKAKKTNENSIIIVTGCYAQVSPDEVSKIDGVDIVLGTSQKSCIIEAIDKFVSSKNQILQIDNIMSIRQFEEMEIDEYQDRVRAFLKIEDGCNRFCSYCMIPYARGPIRSKNPDDVIKEVKKLSDNGFKEITVSGIHISSYGKDLKNINLIDIIELIDKSCNVDRIRIGSIDPDFFDDETINRLKKIKKLCPHFHISLQSGCNNTLKRMNRHYTTEQYNNVITNLRKSISNVSITTDIIVGFPDETDDEFNTTYEFLKNIELSKMHIFKYSPRKGTKAAELKNQIIPEIKESRSKELITLDNYLENKFISKFKNITMNVLFEEKIDNYLYGYTENYIRVKVNADKELIGQIKKVIITDCENSTALGTIIL